MEIFATNKGHIAGTSTGLGNRCSILLSYGASGSFPMFARFMGQPRTRKRRKEGMSVAAQEMAQSVPGMPHEEWRPVIGYEAYYQVSNLGRVRSLKRLKPLIGSIDDCDYHRVTLWTPHGQATKKVHRLVCEAFNGPPNILHREVAHLDGRRRNNRADNLKWVSHVENQGHKYWHGTNPAGSRHPNAKLSEADVIEIRRRAALLERYQNIANDYEVSYYAIDDIVRRRNWRHVT